MKTNTLISLFIFGGAALFLNVSQAQAQMDSSHQMMHGNAHGNITSPERKTPTLPGQGAFGAIQEIVSILEAEPHTDWAHVDISGLRSHLVDMNQVFLKANVQETNIDRGLEMLVTGQGRTLQAIQAMVLAHAPMINGRKDWTVKGEAVVNGAKLTVTTSNRKDLPHIRGLGFFGFMVTDSHHQLHHIGLARGENVHGQK